MESAALNPARFPMRLICPNCQQAVTIPDSDAGKTVTCPNCAHAFPAPQLYSTPAYEPSVPLPPPPAPSYTPALPLAVKTEPATAPTTSANGSAAPPPPPTTTPAADTPAHPVTPEGYAHLRSVALSRKVCEWLVPACLTLIFLLTFFKWVGLYPAGYAAYTQNAWQALFGSMSVDPVSEKSLHLEKDFDERLRASMWLLPYLILVTFAFALTWGDRVVKILNLKMPGVVAGIWKMRPALLSACAGLTIFFIIAQTVAGFGLEKAVTSKIEANFKEERDAAKTPEEIQKVEMDMARVKGSYHVRDTIWLTFTIILHFVALAAIIGETMLIHRGQKPPPRVGVMW
jgi:hypothetical protein